MSSADLPDSPATASGLPPNTPDGTDATADSAGGPIDVGTVEGDSAAKGSDPDLSADDDLDAEDPA